MNNQINNFSPFKTALIRYIRWALRWKTDLLRQGKASSLFLEGLIFQNFRNVRGGKVLALISRGAPIIPGVFYFLTATITPHLIQICSD
jgi:hypothetical protein